MVRTFHYPVKSRWINPISEGGGMMNEGASFIPISVGVTMVSSPGFLHRRMDHGVKFASGKVYTNSIEGFWSFAKERLQKFHRVNAKKFPALSQELVFRCNHRNNDLCDDVVKCLSEYSVVVAFVE
jgi:hypothetical protein